MIDGVRLSAPTGNSTRTEKKAAEGVRAQTLHSLDTTNIETHMKRRTCAIKLVGASSFEKWVYAVGPYLSPSSSSSSSSSSSFGGGGVSLSLSLFISFSLSLFLSFSLSCFLQHQGFLFNISLLRILYVQFVESPSSSRPLAPGALGSHQYFSCLSFSHSIPSDSFGVSRLVFSASLYVQ